MFLEIRRLNDVFWYPVLSFWWSTFELFPLCFGRSSATLTLSRVKYEFLFNYFIYQSSLFAFWFNILFWKVEFVDEIFHWCTEHEGVRENLLVALGLSDSLSIIQWLSAEAQGHLMEFKGGLAGKGSFFRWSSKLNGTHLLVISIGAPVDDIPNPNSSLSPQSTRPLCYCS